MQSQRMQVSSDGVDWGSAATINISSSIGSVIVSNGNQSIKLKDEFIHVAFFFY